MHIVYHRPQFSKNDNASSFPNIFFNMPPVPALKSGNCIQNLLWEMPPDPKNPIEDLRWASDPAFRGDTRGRTL